MAIASAIKMRIQKTDKILPAELAVMAIIVLAQRLGSSVNLLVHIGMVAWAIRSPKNGIQALTISWLLAHLNPGIFPGSGGHNMLKWLVLICCLRHVPTMLRNSGRLKSRQTFVMLFFFTLSVSIFSLVTSYQPLVSILKLGVFTVGLIVVLVMFEITREIKEYWKAWITTLYIFVVVAGFPFYFSGLGFTRNSAGFQGILNHPQAYGIFLAPLLAWFIGRFLFEKDRSFTIIIGIALGLFSLYTSQARTGLLSLVIGLAIACAVALIMNRKWLNTLKGVLGNALNMGVLCFIFVLLIFFHSSLINYSSSFMKKSSRREPTAVFNIYESSRGIVVKNSMDNFFENPWIGIGFGLASDPFDLTVQSDAFLGIPLSAPVEKGFLPSAVLEEIGLIGTFLLIGLIISLMRPILIYGNLPAFCLFCTGLMINMGEMVFFSFGGMGRFLWILFGLTQVLRDD